MRIIICKWGLLRFHAILNYYVDFNFIQNAIQNETFFISHWFFLNLPKMFQKAYILYLPDEKKKHVIRPIQSLEDVNILIDKLEDKENIEVSQNKRDEILTIAQNVLSSPGSKGFWHLFDVGE